MRRKRFDFEKQPRFENEAHLCRRFIELLPKGWTPYAETAGWDILLVRNADGFQIGVQAKMKLNPHVVSQALEDGREWDITTSGPDCRAVLVPVDGASFFDRICDYIGITIVRCHVQKLRGCTRREFYPELPVLGDPPYSSNRDWFEWCPAKRCRLPEYVPDVAAGASAPLQLTDWKIRAIKMAVLLETRGFATRADFKHLRLDYRRWVTSGWLEACGGRFTPLGMPDFKGQHPRVYQEIVADLEKWAPKPEVTLV